MDLRRVVPLTDVVVTVWQEYRKDAAIVYSVEEDLPKLAKILKIYFINGAKVVFDAESLPVYIIVRIL